MRTELFLNILARYLNPDMQRYQFFATSDHFRGGWEGWLQCEIAHAFLAYEANQVITRELPYPSLDKTKPYLNYDAKAASPVAPTANLNSAARADFCIERKASPVDTTFVELKCISSLTGANDAWNRFYSDATKVHALTSFRKDLNCISVLATWGTFSKQEVANISKNVPTAMVLDSGANPLKAVNIKDVATDGAARLFFVAYAGL